MLPGFGKVGILFVFVACSFVCVARSFVFVACPLPFC